MSEESQTLDQKSIRYVLNKQRDADDLACDCVGFANAMGGRIVLGVEDSATEPPVDQRVADVLPEQLHKRINQITVNVGLTVRKAQAANGGEYIEIRVSGNKQSIASMSDGRYFLRVADETRRLLPDDLGRLMTEKNTFVWEFQTTRKVPREKRDAVKCAALLERIRVSDRVSEFVKAKSDDELLDHYFFALGAHLTNLGILWFGERADRAALLYAPLVQCIKYDERGQKVRKHLWVDFDLNPVELIEAVWREVPEWKESYELPDGLFRKTVPHYDEVVVRELLANALVHRPYTQRGDVFLNLYPDRLEVHNPGLLPIGVTPSNILHVTSKRNQHLAKVFYDLGLMEGEGSGFDRMYEVLLSTGRPVPEVAEGNDRVTVTVRKRIINPAIVDFVAKADQTFMLAQRERITLGLLAQHEALTAIQLGRVLELGHSQDIGDWLGRLTQWGIVKTRGRTKGTEYFVEPDLLRKLDFRGTTSLRNIEGHRLRELVLQDLEIYRQAKISEIHKRIGTEIPQQKLRRALKSLVAEGTLKTSGEKRGRQYLLVERA